MSTWALMRLEMISGVERRRRWSVADKLRIVAEADEPSAKVAEVARRHEISRSILWTWRKQTRAGELTAFELGPVWTGTVDIAVIPRGRIRVGGNVAVQTNYVGASTQVGSPRRA